MAGILATLALFGYTLFMRRLIRWPIEAMPLLVVSMVIIINYFFSYLGILRPGSIVLLLTGCLALLLSPVYLPKKREELLAKYFTPGLTIFIFFIIIFGVMAQTIVVVAGWDELDRWLPLTKLIYLNNGFWLPNYHSIQTEYPPGGALFYYFFLVFTGYSEGVIYYAQLLLILSPLVILLSKFTWSNWLDSFIFFSMTLLVLIFVFQVQIGPTGSLYMDTVVATFFGGTLASYLILAKKPGIWLYLLFPVMALSLFKPMLLPFIAIIGMVALCDQFLLKKNANKKLHSLTLYSGIVILPLLIVKSWFYHLHQMGNVTQNWSPKKLLLAVLNRPSLLDTAQFHEVLIKYLHQLYKPGIFIVFAAIMASILYKFSDRLNKQRLLSAHALLLGGNIAFISLLLLLYLYVMGPFIASSLNSFNRFIAIYGIGWFVVLLTSDLYLTNSLGYQFLQRTSTTVKYQIAYGLIILLCLYTGLHTFIHHLRFENRHDEAYRRYAIKQIATPVQELTAENSRIGIVWLGGQGLNQYIIAYELLPRHFLLLDYYLTTPIALENQLRKLDYLLVAHANNSFWHDYGQFFLNTNKNVLKTVEFCLNNYDNGTTKNKTCIQQKFPTFLYKVVVTDNKVQLVNVINYEK